MHSVFKGDRRPCVKDPSDRLSSACPALRSYINTVAFWQVVDKFLNFHKFLAVGKLFLSEYFLSKDAKFEIEKPNFGGNLYAKLIGILSTHKILRRNCSVCRKITTIPFPLKFF